MAITKAELKARNYATQEEEERFQKRNESKAKVSVAKTKEKDLVSAKDSKNAITTVDDRGNETTRIITPKVSTPTKASPAFSATAVSSKAKEEPKRDYSYITNPMDKGATARSDTMARAMGVKDETINEIRTKAAPKYGKDITTEAFQSGVANSVADTVGGFELIYDLLPTSKVAKLIRQDEDYNPFTQLNEPLQQWKQEKAVDSAEAVEEQGGGKTVEMISQGITAATQMVPDVVLSLATAGTSTVAKAGAKAATTGAKGLKALGSAKKILPAVKQAATNTAKNPSFWLNFEQMLYPEYDAAIQNGATEEEATATALLSAFGQAGIESSFGFQKLPNANAPTIRRAAYDYVKSAVAEGNEEVVQGIISGISQKLIFDHDKQLVANESGQDAVLNTTDAQTEWLLGAILGGVMGAPGAMINVGGVPPRTTTADTLNTQSVTPDTLSTEAVVPPVPTAEVPVPPIEATSPNVGNVTPIIENNQQVPFASVEEATEPFSLNNIEQAKQYLEEIGYDADDFQDMSTEEIVEYANEFDFEDKFETGAFEAIKSFDPQNVESMKEYLKKRGYDIDFSSDGSLIAESFREIARENITKNHNFSDFSDFDNWDIAKRFNEITPQEQKFIERRSNQNMGAINEYLNVMNVDPNLYDDSYFYSIYSLITDEARTYSKGDPYSLSPKAAAQAILEAYQQKNRNPGSILTRAFEIDGKKLPESLREQYYSTAEERIKKVEHDIYYYKDMAGYYDAVAKQAERKGNTEYAQRNKADAQKQRERVKELQKQLKILKKQSAAKAQTNSDFYGERGNGQIAPDSGEVTPQVSNLSSTDQNALVGADSPLVESAGTNVLATEQLPINNIVENAQIQPETEQNVDAQNIPLQVQTPTVTEQVGAQNVVTEPQVPVSDAQTVTTDAQNAAPDAQNIVGVETSTAPNRPAAMVNRADLREDMQKFQREAVKNREDKKLSQFVTNTVPKSPLGTDEMLQYIRENNEKFTYAVVTDESSIEYSKNFLEKYGIDGAISHWKDIAEGKARYDKDNGVLAATTIRYLVEQGKIDEAKTMLSELQAEATISAQATQGAETIQKILEPAMLNIGTNSESYVKILTEKLNKKYDKRLKSKIHYNEQLVQEAIAANGTEAEGKAWDKVYTDLANQVPATFWEKATKVRYFCMLSNPRTDIRNISGNVANVGLKAIKDGNKVLVESIVRKANEKSAAKAEKQKKISEDFFQKAKEAKESGDAKLGEYEKKAEDAKKKAKRLEALSEQSIRTVNNILKIDKSTWDYAFADYEKAADIFDKGNKYDTRNGSFVTRYREGNKLVDAKSKALSAEDNFFKRIVYTSTLAQEMAARKITPEMAADPKYARQMSEIQQRAFDEARYTTYNQDSQIADWIARAPEEAQAAITAFQPFLKVPINIVKEGYHYSPLGMLKGFYDINQAFRANADVDINAAINKAARGMTGVELAAVGMLLRHLGKITNGISDDEEDSAYKKLQGEQAFSWKLDDGSTYSIDWIGAPVMPVFTGAMLYDTFSDESFKEKMEGNALTATLSVLLATATSIADPMLSMSMLQNIESLLTQQYDGLEDFLTDGLGDFALSFVPQFIASLTKVIDNTKRNAYFVDKTDNIPDNLQIPFQVAKSRIPGLSQTLPEKADAWGRTETHSDRETTIGHIFDAFISPGTYKKAKTTEADRFLMDVFGGAEDVLPDKQKSNFTVTLEKSDAYGNKENKKEDIVLSNAQYMEYQKEYGTTAENIITELAKDESFKELPYDTQKGIMDDIYSYAQNSAKAKIYDKYYKNPHSDFTYKGSNLVADADAAKEDGLSYSEFFIEKEKYGELETIHTSKDDSIKIMEQFLDYLDESNFESGKKVALLEHVAQTDLDDIYSVTENSDKVYDIFKIKHENGSNAVKVTNALIADKSTNAKEDIEILEKVFDKDLSGAKSATKDSEEALRLYQLESDSKGGGKKEDIKILVDEGMSNAEALAKYNVTSATKKYEKGEFDGFGTSQVKKAEKLKKQGFSGELIAKAACAVTAIGETKYGTTKNYSTYVKMLNAVGITDKEFIDAFWKGYVN